jgi:fibronectin type 3 domain-containing protein/predicted small lipoprotein YifL
MAAGVAMAALTLLGCGKKGPIVAPERRLPQPPADMRATVEDRAIVVRWVNPRNRVDNSRLRDLAVMRLFRREEAPGAEPKPAMLSGDRVVGYEEIKRIALGAPPPPGVQMEGGGVSVTDDKSLSFGRRYVYVATAEDSSGRSSAPSPPVTVTFIAAPAAPPGLSAQAGDKQARLRWEAATTFIDGTPATGELRYIVLRAVGEGALAPVTPAPIAATTYTDTGLENETAYRYAVKGVRVDPAGTAIGPASSAVVVTPVDTTPPSAPTRLIGIPAAGSVRLAWNPSPEDDVAQYAVYRAEGTGPFTRIATTAAISTIYTDRDVQSGRTYRYAVTALDRAKQPNESPRSNEVTVTVP